MSEVVLNFLERFHRDESGQGMVEYLLMLALIAFGAMAALQGAAASVAQAFAAIGTKLSAALS